MTDLFAALLILAGGGLAALFFLTAWLIFGADHGDYEMSRVASGSFSDLLSGQVPTDDDGETGATRQYGMAVTRDGQVVPQGAISEHAIDRIVRHG
ncbi:MAG: hypothetical protein HZA24_02575 [Nitrospirae bacterium]|nr:hypothetical protein [Nitrospirota bacterium]